MSNGLVSIIIPTYNRAHLIGETLDSVLAQTYQNWECIVVDDGSTDYTETLMAEYMAKDARIQYHHRPNDRLPGGNAARNYGVELSKGRYINFLDSDDLFHPMTLKVKCGEAESVDADVVISKHCRDKNILSSEITFKECFISSTFDRDFILSRNSILIGEPLINKRALSDIKFDEELVRSQDYDFLLRLFRKKLKYCRIDAVLYCYTVNINSITSRAGKGKRKESRAQLEVIRQNLLYYQGVEEIEAEYLRRIRKMYKSLVEKNRADRILENYNLYKKAFKLSFFMFSFYFFINLLFKNGFDKMKYKL